MQNDVAVLQNTIAGLDRGRGRPYPPELREEMVRTARMLREADWSWASIGKAFGMSTNGLKRFMRRWDTRVPRATPTMRAVTVGETAPAARLESTLQVVSPRGWRIEGLTIDTAAAPAMGRKIAAMAVLLASSPT